MDISQLQTNPVDYPIQVFIAGQADVWSVQERKDILTLRAIAGQVEDIISPIPHAARVNDDWGEESARAP